MLELLKASTASHVRQQQLETARVGMSLALAATGLVAAFSSVTAPVITVVGATWALTYTAAISPLTRGHARRSAVIQEMFDTELFGLPWNSTLAGGPLRPDEISQLVRAFRPRRGRGD